MIASFGNALTEDLYRGRTSTRTRKVPPDVIERTLRKLSMIDAAHDFADLEVPPGNRLEKLRGNHAGWWSIRDNDQWRIIFRWVEGTAHEVTFCDYH